MLVNVGCKALPGKRQYFHLLNMVLAGAGVIIQVGTAVLKFNDDMVIANFIRSNA